MKNMKQIKVLSLFSGLGAFEKALTNLNIDYELINYCEIEPHASKCYAAIHSVSESLNLKDVSTINTTSLPSDIDLITHGSPCQDFSSAGKQKGGIEGSGTRSSLLYETLRIVKDTKPKYIIWENVKNVISKKHLPIFNDYLDRMCEFGYNNSFKVLNSKDYGIPQSRERVFVVSIRNDLNINFEFPQSINLKHKLIDLIDFREKDDITNTFYNRYIKINGEISKKDFINYIKILPQTKGNGGFRFNLYNFNEMNFITSVYGITGTLTCRNVQNLNKKYFFNDKLYKPSPLMCFRLMGFSDSDFDKCKNIGKDSDLYNRAGNSIVVNVVEEIFKKLFRDE